MLCMLPMLRWDDARRNTTSLRMRSMGASALAGTPKPAAFVTFADLQSLAVKDGSIWGGVDSCFLRRVDDYGHYHHVSLLRILNALLAISLNGSACM